MATTALAPAEVRSIATVHELEVDDVIHQVQKIQHVMEAVMKPGEHYGVIPGTGTKPTLLKPGAEKLCLVFRLDPQYEVTQTLSEGAHLTIVSRCTLYHIPTGNRMGSGMGSCSTKESKYAYRQAKRSCPTCGQEAIIKGKAEWGGGWVCFKKQGGCGAKYADADSTITGQQVGRIANPDLPDSWNTIIKMANKRSLVAAVLNVTAASDLMTQDLEDMPLPPAPPPPDTAVPARKKVVPPGPPMEVEEREILVNDDTAPPEPWEILVSDYVAQFDEATTKKDAEGWRERWLKIRETVPDEGRRTVTAAIERAQKRFS